MAGRDSFNLIFTAYDRANKRNLYLKPDGRRFSSSQTVKVCTDVKYDVTVVVKPPAQELEKLVIGGDSITPDTSTKQDDRNEYTFTWLTSGFKATSKGKRSELRISFFFGKFEVAQSLQVKFYPLGESAHLTWGTEVHRIEMEVRGAEQSGEATPFKTLVPTKMNFK